jgi:hypothetical protein
MKKLLVFCLGVLLASSVFATIVGSGHDLSGNGWALGQICIVCHTPHNATLPMIIPLWNHDSSVGPWTPYVDTGDNTLDSTPGQPQSCSIACLSCHDGTVAVDSFGGTVGTVMIGTIGTGSGDLGTDLTDDHPISFTYGAALATADGELYDPTITNAGLPSTPGNIDVAMLKGPGNDQLECCSCHDVHNTECPACPYLLVKDNTGSALCLTCHDK